MDAWEKLKAEIEAADWRDLPRGHYAIPEAGDEEDDYAFLGYWIYERKVSRTTKTGRKIGQDRLVEGGFRCHDGVTSEQLDRVFEQHKRQWDIHTMLEHPDRLRAEFGKFTGRCGCCGKALTDPDSKMRGIGPECRRMGRRPPAQPIAPRK